MGKTSSFFIGYNAGCFTSLNPLLILIHAIHRTYMFIKCLLYILVILIGKAETTLPDGTMMINMDDVYIMYMIQYDIYIYPMLYI